MVLYTPAAQLAGNPLEDAIVFVENMNQAFQNSQICQGVELVKVRPFDFPELYNGEEYDGEVNLFNDRDALKDDPQAKALRNQYGADIVILLTDSGGEYLENNNAFGIAFLNNFGEADFGYAIAEITSPSGRHTFAHELAHLFGAEHDLIISPGFAHGYQFETGNSIMAIGSNVMERVLHYSNPDVYYNGAVTGIEDLRDNARQIDNLGCTLAVYRHSPYPCDDFYAVIDGPSVVFNDNVLENTWCVNISEMSGCEGNITFRWEYSYTGLGKWFPGGIDDCFTIAEDNRDLHLRVTAICDDGCAYTAYKFVKFDCGIIPCDEDENQYNFIILGNGKEVLTNKIKITPNPANSSVKIDIEEDEILGEEEEKYNYYIYDLIGGLEKSGQWSRQTEIDVSFLPSGIYTIIIKSSKTSYNENFIIQK